MPGAIRNVTTGLADAFLAMLGRRWTDVRRTNSPKRGPAGGKIDPRPTPVHAYERITCVHCRKTLAWMMPYQCMHPAMETHVYHAMPSADERASLLRFLREQSTRACTLA